MFEVRWVRSALEDLAEIWIGADPAGRTAMTAATREIDAQLTTNPDEAGESREPGRRILLAPPLGVKFRVERRNQTVVVLKVWQFTWKGGGH